MNIFSCKHARYKFRSPSSPYLNRLYFAEYDDPQSFFHSLYSRAQNSAVSLLLAQQQQLLKKPREIT
jgi:hypothetical protein